MCRALALVSNIKLLLHQQLVLSFFSLIRVKYDTLMHQMRRLGSVEVSALACQTERSGSIRAGHAWNI